MPRWGQIQMNQKIGLLITFSGPELVGSRQEQTGEDLTVTLNLRIGFKGMIRLLYEVMQMSGHNNFSLKIHTPQRSRPSSPNGMLPNVPKYITSNLIFVV